MKKKTRFSKLFRLLRLCDNFGVPVCFIMGKEFVYRSKFSAMISLIIGLSFFIILITELVRMTQR